MSAKLLQHVIKKSQAGMNLTMACTVQVKADFNFCFRSISFHLRFPRWEPQKFVDFIPGSSGERNSLHFLLTDESGFTAKVFCEFYICFPVANHIRIGQVVFTRQLFTQPAGPWFSGGSIFILEESINMNGGNYYPFVFQGFVHPLFSWQVLISTNGLRTQ